MKNCKGINDTHTFSISKVYLSNLDFLPTSSWFQKIKWKNTVTNCLKFNHSPWIIQYYWGMFGIQGISWYGTSWHCVFVVWHWLTCFCQQNGASVGWKGASVECPAKQLVVLQMGNFIIGSLYSLERVTDVNYQRSFQ